MTIAQSALKWMLNLAADQSHGYSQQSRWGPDYDCSSAVISSYKQAGLPLTCTYTGDMKGDMLKKGFKDVTKSCNLVTGAGLLPGDVLLNENGRGTSGNGHAAMYAGNGQLVHARGQSYGSSKTGDQGTEIAVTAYRNHPYDCVLRYTGGTASTPVTTPVTVGVVGECMVTLPLLIVGAICPEVKTIQACLNAKGYKGKDGKMLDVDGELGENTAYAITALQKKAGMKNINFGTVAKATWLLILK